MRRPIRCPVVDSFEFSTDVFPSLKRRGGCASDKKSRSHRSGADGVVGSARSSDLSISPGRPPRPLVSKVASQRLFDLAASPPFQGGEKSPPVSRQFQVREHLKRNC